MIWRRRPQPAPEQAAQLRDLHDRMWRAIEQERDDLVISLLDDHGFGIEDLAGGPDSETGLTISDLAAVARRRRRARRLHWLLFAR